MKIFADNKTPNHIIFNAKKVPARFSKCAGILLENEYITLDNRIKDYLSELLNNGISKNQDQIAVELKITRQRLTKRILKNDELKLLWDNIYALTLDVSKDIDKRIKKVLEEAIQTGEHIGGKDIAVRVGLNLQACLARIRHDKILNVLFQGVNHVPKIQKTEDSKKIDIIINKFLEDAFAKKNTVLFRDIAKLTGLTERQAHDRIYRTPFLRVLWEKLDHFSIPKKSDTSRRKDNLIKLVIQKAHDENRTISVSDLAKETGLSESDCSHRIHRNPDIKELWQNTKKRGNLGITRNVISKNVKEKLIKDIELILVEAKKESGRLSFNEVLERLDCNLTKKQIISIIYQTQKLSVLWNELEHNGGSNSLRKEYLKGLNEKLKTILNNAIDAKKSLIFEDLAAELNITVPKVKHQIYDNEELRSLWDRIPQRSTYIEPKTSSVKTNVISKALDKIKLEKRKVNKKELAQELGMPWTALNDKIRRTPELREKWSTIERRTILKSSEDVNDRLLEIIEKAIKNKSFIGAKEIAEQVGVSYPTCAQRLQKSNGILNARWKELLSIKSDKNQELDNKIRTFLENCITTRQSIGQKELSAQLEIPLTVFQYRLKLSDELIELWYKVKNIENETLKDFCKLKGKELDYKEIIKKLKISEEKFDDLNSKYKKIKSILENSEIAEKELLDWIILSKRDFELAISEIFTNMGYDAKATRYSGDNGIDVVAYKNGQKTIIECMHNIYNETDIEELLALQGNKHYYDADKVIYIASSGVYKNGQKFVEKFGKDFEIITLADIIKLSKKYNFDVNTMLKVKSKINEASPKNKQEYIGNWTIPSKLSEKEAKNWRSMKPKAFELKVIELFEANGYAVKRCDELDLNGYYLINKGGKRSVIKCHTKNAIPTLDSIKALYGLRDYYKTDDVILIGPSAITSMSKDFIDTVNKKENNSYKILSLESVVNLIL